MSPPSQAAVVVLRASLAVHAVAEGRAAGGVVFVRHESIRERSQTGRDLSAGKGREWIPQKLARLGSIVARDTLVR
jgi:hypothetical protein